MLGILSLIGFLAAGILLYPAEMALNEGGQLPEILRRALWLEMCFFSFQLASILSRWVAILRLTGAGRNEELYWAFGPYDPQKLFSAYFVRTLSVAVIVVFCMVGALNLFETAKPAEYPSEVWVGFIMFSAAAYHFVGKALDLMVIVHVVAEKQYLALDWSRTPPVAISTILILIFLVCAYTLLTGQRIG
jgi:hypothetical protein